MSDILRQTEAVEKDVYDRVWELAIKLKETGGLDLTGVRDTYGNLLHELEKTHDFNDAYEHARPGIEPAEMRLTAPEYAALGRLRTMFPSDEDRIWQSTLV